jgi:hypothetical protein
MFHTSVWSRRLAIALALVLAIVIGLFARPSRAAAVMLLHGPTTASCAATGATAQATFQDNYFGTELHGFLDQETVSVSVQFPDGRIFSVLDTLLLDGVVNLPPHYTTVYDSDVAGDLYFELPVTNKWPYGCYKLSAVGLGSGQTAVGYLVVKPQGPSAPSASPAKLVAWNNGTFNAGAPHGSLVNIHGTGFLPNEVVSVWITQPNGAVIDYPQQITSDAGNFESSFVFSEAYPTGRYTFTALGTISGYQVFAPFDLQANSSTPSGWAQLRVAYPFPAKTNQNDWIDVSGTLFSPGETVGLWMTLPDNSVRGLPSQIADGNGDFFVDIDLDERLPVGHYSVTAKGLDSGRLVIATFDVTGGQFEGYDANTAGAPPVPNVDVSNIGDGTLGGPTNVDVYGAPVTEQTPADTFDCSAPEHFWTPNCTP